MPVGMPPHFFHSKRQHPDSFGVTRTGLPSGWQNIDSKWLAGKIFTNKGLGVLARPVGGRAGLAPDCFGLVGTVPLWAFPILGQGRSSHDWEIFLWRAVEKLEAASGRSSGSVSVMAISHDLRCESTDGLLDSY